jgi:hypothetical protein
MSEKRAVRLVHFLANLGANGVVRFHDVEGDVAVVMACEDFALSILAGGRRHEIEGDSGFGLLDFAGDRKSEAEKTINEAMLRHLDALPPAQIFGLSEIRDRMVELAGGAEGTRSRVNEPIACFMLEIRAVGHATRRVGQRRVPA